VAALAALAALAAAANGTFVVFWSVQYFANNLTFQSTFKTYLKKKMRNAFFCLSANCNKTYLCVRHFKVIYPQWYLKQHLSYLN
jgi:hypothetical protein